MKKNYSGKSRKGRNSSGVGEVKEWFRRNVTFEDEPYTVDDEQAEAIFDSGKNTIVVARAGSGKTRTIVAKIIYMVAKLGVRPEEILVFVFNANAASEINERLDKMRVNGENVINGVKVASTFHAFSRKIVYEICHGEERSGKILAGDREKFMLAIVKGMMRSRKWNEKIRLFLGEEQVDADGAGKQKKIDSRLLFYFAKMMILFVNRAQQKFLAGEHTLRESLDGLVEPSEREEVFVELGAECYRRYHWLLLDEKARVRLGHDFSEYGTDFNLIVSWASKLIGRGGPEVMTLVGNKRYVLIDEYQDFSQLFLSIVLAIRKVNPGINLFVVGDDWQAINRFAGSEVEYFKEFERFFPEDVRRMEISTNYRCDYSIVRVARKFMKRAMGENGNIRAFSKRAGKVMLVNPGDFSGDYLDLVAKLILENRKAKDILLLHRNNEMNKPDISLAELGEELAMRLCSARTRGERGAKRGARMSKEEFDSKVKIMTMHKSKGLEAEVVIILEADEGVIPKIHADIGLQRVFGETDEISLDDQKRLFYVAMTRAKKRLYIIYNPVHGEGFRGYLGDDFKRWEP